MKGFYHQCIRAEHDDDRLRGAIDIARHIRLNYPFTGNIVDVTRELLADNPATGLMHPTIEYIGERGQETADGILHAMPDRRDPELDMPHIVRIIRDITPSYSRGDRNHVFQANIRLDASNDDEPYGILFDGSGGGNDGNRPAAGHRDDRRLNHAQDDSRIPRREGDGQSPTTE